MFTGKPVQGVMPESLRLYILCKSMKWTHLPVAGGIYDQHPKLLDDWLAIMAVDHEVEERKLKEQERKAKSGAPQAVMRRGSPTKARARRRR